MKEIKLTQGKSAQVDNEDFEYLDQFKWQAHWDGYNWYAVRTVYNPKRLIIMHRVIMKTPDNLEVDHVNHNGLDCQKNNMRNCTHGENMMNSKKINWIIKKIICETVRMGKI